MFRGRRIIQPSDGLHVDAWSGVASQETGCMMCGYEEVLNKKEMLGKWQESEDGWVN